MHGTDIGKSPARAGDGELCARIAAEEEQSGVGFLRVGCFFFLRINIVEHLSAVLRFLFEIIADGNGVRGVDVAVPGQAQIPKRFSAVISAVHGKDQSAKIAERGISDYIGNFCVSRVCRRGRCVFPKVPHGIVGILVCRDAVVGIALLDTENKIAVRRLGLLGKIC